MRTDEAKIKIQLILDQYDAHEADGSPHGILRSMGALVSVCRKFVKAADRDEREAALATMEAACERMSGLGPYRYDSVSFRELADAAKVLAWPVPSSSRWVVLPFTSGSGKILFRCGVCGRLSNTPDKTCPDDWGCDSYTGYPPVGVAPVPEGFK